MDKSGEISYNRFGSELKIIEYRKYKDIDVLVTTIYKDKKYEFITTNRNYKDFKNGYIKSPYDISILGIGYYGDKLYSTSSEGFKIFFSYIETCYKDNSYTVIDDWKCYQLFKDWYNQNTYYIKDDTLSLYRLNIWNKNFSPDNCILIPKSLSRSLLTYCSKINIKIRKPHRKYIAKITNSNKDILYLKSFDNRRDAFNAFNNEKYKIIFNSIYKYKDIIPEDILLKLIINIRV